MKTDTWKRTPHAGDNGCMQLWDIALARVTFGDPTPHEAYLDEEAGYMGDDWFFTNDAGDVAHLYSRWGTLRVGAVSPEIAADFNAWLTFLTGTPS
jgi:hypothetical protein